MERLSILINQRHLDLDLHYNTEKIPEYLCENCGKIVGSKQSLKCHIVTKHSEKVTTYQCSKCLTTCNRLDNMRCHIKKHPGQTITPKIVMYESNETTVGVIVTYRPSKGPIEDKYGVIVIFMSFFYKIFLTCMCSNLGSKC